MLGTLIEVAAVILLLLLARSRLLFATCGCCASRPGALRSSVRALTSGPRSRKDAAKLKSRLKQEQSRRKLLEELYADREHAADALAEAKSAQLVLN